MNANTTELATIHQRDVAPILSMHPHLAGISLAALDRQRGLQAEAEGARLLKQHGVLPASAASLVAMLRRSIVAALVHAGVRIAGVPRSAVLPEKSPSSGSIGTAN